MKLANMVDMIRFSAQVFAAVPRTWKFSSEIFRQAGILILSSGFIICFMQLLVGGVFAVQGYYIMRQFGAGGYMSVFTALGGLRLSGPEMSGWILAAKVGCGLVAELGSARISEEIDALEVMGVEPKAYLVATRLLAALIAMPFLYAIGIWLFYFGSWAMVVHVLHGVSEGGFLTVLWSFTSPLDLLFSMLLSIVLGVVVILVGCYYGFTASGGPVGVGQNTAKSMVVNMVLVSVLGLAIEQAFWGGFGNNPIAN